MGKELRHVYRSATPTPDGSDQTIITWTNRTGHTVFIRFTALTARFSFAENLTLRGQLNKQNGMLNDGDEQWSLNLPTNSGGQADAVGTDNAQVGVYRQRGYYEGALEVEAGEAISYHIAGSAAIGAGFIEMELSYNLGPAAE